MRSVISEPSTEFLIASRRAGGSHSAGGPRTDLGDTQIFNLTLTQQDIGPPEKVTFGIGPLIVVPTNTSTNFGTNSVYRAARSFQRTDQTSSRPKRWFKSVQLTDLDRRFAFAPSRRRVRHDV